MLNFARYPYIIQIVNIHKQAKLTKNNGQIEWSWMKGHATILHNISGNECNEVFYPYTCRP